MCYVEVTFGKQTHESSDNNEEYIHGTKSEESNSDKI